MKTLKWIYQYKCGCTDGPKYKRDMLEYCGKHGSELQEKYPDIRPIKKKKVYGGTFFLKGEQVRGIFAGTQVELAKITRSSVKYIRDYWCVTENKKELEIALKEPGILFWCDNNHYSNREYFKVE